jgi:site-specific recombinase XerD
MEKKTMSHEIEILTEEEQVKFVLFFHKNLPTPTQRLQQTRDRLIMLLMLDAGLRVSEAISLTISDLHMLNAPVSMIFIRPEISKTKTERSVPVTSRLSDAIQEMWLNVWQAWSFLHYSMAFPDSRKRKHISARQIERIIQTAGMCSIGRPVHPHMLRHTFATRLMKKCNIRIVQTLLGHKALSSTQIYTHVNTQDIQAAIDSLNAIAR